MPNGVEGILRKAQEEEPSPFGAAFTQRLVQPRQPVRRPTLAPVAEDPLTQIKNVASIVAEARGGVKQPAEETPTTPGRTTGPFPVLDRGGNVIGTRGVAPRTTATQPFETRQAAEAVDPAKTPARAVTPGGVERTAPEETPKTTTTEADAEKAVAKKEKAGFFKDLTPERRQDLIRAALTAGTSILEAADPTGAFTRVSRGVLEGTKVLERLKEQREKAKAAERREKRTEAGEKRKEAGEKRKEAGEKRAEKRLGLEERRVAAAERGVTAKTAAEKEERRIKTELEAAGAVVAGTLSEQLAAAEQARQLAEFAGGRGVIVQPGQPERKEGGFFGIGAKTIPATPPRIAFPSRRTPTQERVREGVEARTASERRQTFRDFLR
jgi:hypothetical protein